MVYIVNCMMLDRNIRSQIKSRITLNISSRLKAIIEKYIVSKKNVNLE